MRLDQTVTRALLQTILAVPDIGSGQQILEVDYSTGRKIIDDDLTRIPVRVSGDSVLVFQQDRAENGTLQLYMGSTNQVSMHPLRPVSGEACENPEFASS